MMNILYIIAILEFLPHLNSHSIFAENVCLTRVVTSYFCTIIDSLDPNCTISGTESLTWCSYGDTTRTSTVPANELLMSESILTPFTIHRLREISQRSSTSTHGAMANYVTVTITMCQKPGIFAAIVCG